MQTGMKALAPRLGRRAPYQSAPPRLPSLPNRRGGLCCVGDLEDNSTLWPRQHNCGSIFHFFKMTYSEGKTLGKLNYKPEAVTMRTISQTLTTGRVG